MSEKQPAVYILANRRNGTLYTGVTSNLATRVWQHKNDVVEGFTKKYGVHTLEQITILCSPSTSGALRLTLRPNGLPFVLSVAEQSRSRDAGSRPA